MSQTAHCRITGGALKITNQPDNVYCAIGGSASLTVAATGTVVTTYLYDAWGNHLHTTGSLSATVGRYNPLRYRGYVYDRETGLYYLQSRYYNPKTGRFINADGIVSVGAEILGNNLFVYCFNNPIIATDETGYLPQWLDKFIDGVGEVAKTLGSGLTQAKAASALPSTALKIVGASAFAVISGQASLGDLAADFSNFSLYNNDEQKCLDAKVFSSYKGTPVLKQSIWGGSMSIFNTLFLSRKTNNQEIVKHEWGHTVQQSVMGTHNYLTDIVVPSMKGALMGVDDYFSQPWERSADFLGGANNGPYTEGSGWWALLYFFVS